MKLPNRKIHTEIFSENTRKGGFDKTAPRLNPMRAIRPRDTNKICGIGILSRNGRRMGDKDTEKGQKRKKEKKKGVRTLIISAYIDIKNNGGHGFLA